MSGRHDAAVTVEPGKASSLRIVLLGLCLGALAARGAAEEMAADLPSLIAALGDDDYAIRENAAARLAEAGPAAVDALLAAAETAGDLEVALRARWLVQAMPLALTTPDDPPAASTQLTRFIGGDEEARLRALHRLLRLDDDAGIEPLARIVRLEHDPRMASLAAALLAREWRPGDPYWPGLRLRIARGLGTSPRAAARFLRSLVGFSQAAEAGKHDPRGAAVNDAVEALEQLARVARDRASGSESGEVEADAQVDPNDQSSGALRELRRCLCLMLIDAGQRDRAVRQSEPLLAPGEAVSPALIAEDLAWLTARGLPEAVDVLRRRWPDLEIDEPAIAFAAALALAARGEPEDAERRASEASRRLRDGLHDATQRLRIASRLAAWGAFDWADREYEAFLADPATPPDEFGWASILHSEQLHDRGLDDRAAEVLATVIDGRPKPDGGTLEQILPWLDREPPAVRSRMLFFQACSAAARGDAAGQRQLVDEAVRIHPQDVDSLIALDHLSRQSDAEPPRRAEAMALVARALERLDAEIEGLPEDSNSLNEYAWLVANTGGDVDKALRYARLALDRLADNASYLDTLAHCQAAAGDLQAAVRTQSLAHRLEPHQLTIRRNLDRFRAQADLPAGSP